MILKNYLLIVLFILSSSLSAQDFDPIRPDYELLKTLVIEKINQKRARREKLPLMPHKALQTTSDNYTVQYRASKFEKNAKNKERINKKFKKKCRLNGYKNAYTGYHITSVNCVNIRSSKFYLDKKDTETATHLFVGKKPTRKEQEKETFQAVPIKLYSYQELADLISKQFISDEGTFKILNNGFNNYGFSLAVEQNTLFRNRLPKIKAIIILGGSRISW